MRKSINGTISAGDFGSRPLAVTRVEHGIKVLALEDSARNRRVFHPKKVVPAPFSITVALASYEEYRDLNQWLLSVVKEQIVAEATTPFRVDIPTFGFHQFGILESDINLGDVGRQRPVPGDGRAPPGGAQHHHRRADDHHRRAGHDECGI
jgi:hypothetical protein